MMRLLPAVADVLPAQGRRERVRRVDPSGHAYRAGVGVAVHVVAGGERARGAVVDRVDRARFSANLATGPSGSWRASKGSPICNPSIQLSRPISAAPQKMNGLPTHSPSSVLRGTEPILRRTTGFKQRRVAS